MRKRSWHGKGRLKNKISFVWDLQSKKKVIVLLSAVMLISMAIVFGPYMAEYADHLRELHQELDLKKQLFAIKEANLAAVAVNTEKLLEFSRTEQQKIHPYAQLPDALANASRLMEACDITEIEFLLAEKGHMTAEPWSNTNELIRVKIKMGGLGKYADVKQYIHTLMNDNFYYHMDAVTMTSKHMTSKELVHVTLELSIFVHKTAGERANLDWPEINGSRQDNNPFYYEEAIQ